MSIAYKNENRGKLLAAIMAMVMAVVCIAVVVSDDVHGADAPTSVDAKGFMALADNEDGVITLDKDYQLTETVTLSKSLTINLNGHTLSSTNAVGNMFYNADGEQGQNAGTSDVDLTIDGTVDGSKIDAAQRVVFFRATACDLTINGGTYVTGADGFIWYGIDGETLSTVTVENATVTTGLSAFWLSNYALGNVSIDKSTINSGEIAVYLATAQKATITDSTIRVSGEKSESAIEIKAGDVTISGCTISAEKFEASDASINNNGSGSGISTLEINNGYTTVAKVTSVSVTVNDTEITNGSSATPVQIVAGNTSTDTAATGSITFSSNCIGAEKINMALSDAAKAADVSITLNLEGKKLSQNVDRNKGITEDQAKSGAVLIVTDDLPAQGAKNLTGGTSLVIANGASYAGDLTIDETSGVQVVGGSFDGTVSNGTGTAATASDVEMTGNFTITYGSIAIGGQNYSGTIDLTQGTLDVSGIIARATHDQSQNALTINAAAGTTVVIDQDLVVGEGGLVINQTGTGVVNVVIEAGVTVDSAMTLGANTVTSIDGTVLVNRGATFTVNGQLTNGGTLSNNGSVVNAGTFTNTGTVMNNGTIRNSGSFNNNGSIYNANANSFIGNPVIGNPALNGFGISTDMDAIESDLPLTGYAFLTGNLTIPEGKSITVRSNGVLDLNGFTLTVNGTLVVEMGGTVIGAQGGENVIVLAKGGISNDGVIGSGDVAVTVQTSDSSKVQLLNVEGVDFGTTKVGGNVYLTVTGDVITAINSYTTYTFDMDGAYVSGDLTIAPEIETVIGTNGITVMRDAVLTIDGTVSGQTVNMLNGSTVVVNGTCDSTISAKTGVRETSKDTALGTTTVDLDGVNGVTVTVSSVAYVENNAAGVPTSYTEFALYISGEVDFTDAAEAQAGTGTTPTGSITVTNTKVGDVDAISRIAADTSLVLPDGVTMDAGNTVVLGCIEYVEAQDAVNNYIGTQYSVREGNDTTYFVREFSDALGYIAGAERKTLNVHGPVEVTEGFTLSEGIINIVNNSGFKVSDDAEVIVQNGARITGVVSEVTGVLTVERGGNVQSVFKYAVYSEGSDGSRTYAGFVAALEKSQAGDRITVSGVNYADDELVIDEDVTIPEDRTVLITHDIRFEGDLTVAAGATVNNQAEILMLAEDATVTVNGVLDSTAANAKVDFNTKNADADRDRNILVTGEYRVASADALTYQVPSSSPATYYAYVNGAYYTDDGVTIVTSFANAVAAITADADIAKLVTVIGTVSETGDVTVAGANTLVFEVVIAAGADVTLGNVTLDYSKITVNGELTATLTGAYGVDGASDASVGLVDVTNFVMTNGYAPNELAESVWYNQITTVTTGVFTGAIDIAAGEVQLVKNSAQTAVSEFTIATGEEDGFTVSDGATLVIPTGITLTIGETFGAEGTVAVQGVLKTVVGTPGTVTTVVAGTIDVQKDNSVSGTFEVPANSVLVLTGTLNVAEGADASVAGTLQLGETPKMLGSAVSATGEIVGEIAVTGTVKAYNGTAVGEAEFVNSTGVALKSTTYTINGIQYATVFTAVSNNTVNMLDTEIDSLRDLAVEHDSTNNAPAITWYAGETELEGTESIGQYSEVSTEIRYSGIEVLVSVGSHISLSIDGVILHSTTSYPLTIGTHQVSAVVDAGYSGEVTITFNGQAVTNGQITVTSDMLNSLDTIVLSASGNISQDSTIVVDGGSSDSGMGLTDYLLIVLVVLIVIMAIIVAMRLMRS